MIFEFPDEWAGKHTVPEIIKLRDEFQGPQCTCDACQFTLVCRLAYDEYNTDGDCLVEK